MSKRALVPVDPEPWLTERKAQLHAEGGPMIWLLVDYQDCDHLVHGEVTEELPCQAERALKVCTEPNCKEGDTLV